MKKLNWFRNLDSSELANIFPGEFEKTMMSADPDVNINTFINDCRKRWDALSQEEKTKLYNTYSS